MKQPGRSARIIMTPEARVLRKLRLKHGLTLRAVGSALGFTNSYIAQIENGRLNPPKGERLLPYLKLYGDISPKYFQELCKNWRDEKTDADIIRELLDKLSPEHVKLLRGMAEQMAAKKL